ncbi:UNVERIFIED_ORG: hypothetical protein FHR35_000374 [Microbispora rosea subsp. rosea]
MAVCHRLDRLDGGVVVGFHLVEDAGDLEGDEAGPAVLRDQRLPAGLQVRADAGDRACAPQRDDEVLRRRTQPRIVVDPPALWLTGLDQHAFHDRHIAVLSPQHLLRATRLARIGGVCLLSRQQRAGQHGHRHQREPAGDGRYPVPYRPAGGPLDHWPPGPAVQIVQGP